ncbi:MAG: hypothetical protein DMG70_01975 [Acidobacteria bacterium]|nr:MAG: hypothetical protein DMG70_01975 [Acidobacteriota bacterium]
MDLYQRVSDAYRTGGVDVESYEDEGTMVVPSVLPDIFALHCSHVSAKRDWCAQSGAGAQPADLGVKDRTAEITDFRRIIELGERYWCGRQGIASKPNTVAPPGMGLGSAVFAAARAKGRSANSVATAKPAAPAAVLKNPRRVKFLASE